jgi:hypothetical protein
MKTNDNGQVDFSYYFKFVSDFFGRVVHHFECLVSLFKKPDNIVDDDDFWEGKTFQPVRSFEDSLEPSVSASFESIAQAIADDPIAVDRNPKHPDDVSVIPRHLRAKKLRPRRRPIITSPPDPLISEKASDLLMALAQELADREEIRRKPKRPSPHRYRE